MSTHLKHEEKSEEEPAHAHDASLWPTLIVTGAALVVGYAAGRVTHARDVRDALRRIEESPEPIEVTVRTLW